METFLEQANFKVQKSNLPTMVWLNDRGLACNHSKYYLKICPKNNTDSTSGIEMAISNNPYFMKTQPDKSFNLESWEIECIKQWIKDNLQILIDLCDQTIRFEALTIQPGYKPPKTKLQLRSLKSVQVSQPLNNSMRLRTKNNTIQEWIQVLNEAPGDENPDVQAEAPADTPPAEGGDKVWTVGTDTEKKPEGDAPTDGGEAVPADTGGDVGGSVPDGGDGDIEEPDDKAGNPDEDPPGSMVAVHKSLEKLKKTAKAFIERYGSGVLDQKGSDEVQKRLAQLMYREEGTDQKAVKDAMKSDKELNGTLASLASLKDPEEKSA